MFLTLADISDFNERKLIDFIEKKIPEGLYIDYKVNLSGKEKRSTYREFLKDVTAFANANGGNILIGVKEPHERLTSTDQIIGIDNGENIAKDLERLASTSIDPRIPGLRVLPVTLSNGKATVLVHIPPSLGRPHMVNHEKHRSFYIRHTESSVPMSTHEIRESVIASLSSEARGNSYMKTREEDTVKYYMEEIPMILMQAMPLIPPEHPWEINKEIENIVVGYDQRTAYRGNDLICPHHHPIIEGIQGKDEPEDFKFVTEVHRNGYISAVFRNKPYVLNGQKGKYLHAVICNLFEAFCKLCTDLTAVTNTDLPYILRCKYLGAYGTIFICAHDYPSGEKRSDPYIKDTIIWPDQVKQIGDDFIRISEIWCEQLFNAFNEKNPS